MIKKIVILISLFLMVLTMIGLLKKSLDMGTVLQCTSKIPPIISIKENPITINAGSSFYPQNFIDVYYWDEYTVEIDHNYDIENTGEKIIDIYVLTANGLYTGSMTLNVVAKEKEIITVEKIVYQNDNQEKKTENADKRNPEEQKDEEVIIQEISEPDYFEGYHDIDLPVDSSVSFLAQALSKDIRTNMLVSIDYTNVNLSQIGIYEVYYYTDLGKFTVFVNIY